MCQPDKHVIKERNVERLSPEQIRYLANIFDAADMDDVAEVLYRAWHKEKYGFYPPVGAPIVRDPK